MYCRLKSILVVLRKILMRNKKVDIYLNLISNDKTKFTQMWWDQPQSYQYLKTSVFMAKAFNSTSFIPSQVFDNVQYRKQ